MENNSLCTSINPAPLPSCDENYVNPVKTLKVEESVYEKYKEVIEEAKATGRSIIIHGSDLSVAQTIALAGSMANLSLANLHAPPEIGMLPANVPKIPEAIQIKNYLEPLPALPSVQKSSNEIWHKQGKAIEAADIPEGTKRLIAAEYIRLKGLHPKWKASKAARKAGEKYSVKFEFHD